MNEYVQLPTADYDEQNEIQQVSLKKQKHNRNLETLEESLLRVGEMSLKISDEIELQNLSVKDLEEGWEEMDINNESFERESRTAVENQQFIDNLICIVIFLIIVVLIIAIALKLSFKH